MHFNKSHSGFTLPEVLIALVIIGISITTILGLQGTLLTTVFRTSQNIEHSIEMKNFFYEARLKQFALEDKVHEKIIDDGRVRLTYQVRKINEKSALKKLDSLVIELIEAHWKVGNQEKVDSMISFLYKPEKPA